MCEGQSEPIQPAGKKLGGTFVSRRDGEKRDNHLISDGGLYAPLVTYTSESWWLAADLARELLDGLSRLRDLLDLGVRWPREDGRSVAIVYSDNVLWLSSPADPAKSRCYKRHLSYDVRRAECALTVGGISSLDVRQRLRRPVVVFVSAGRGHVVVFADTFRHFSSGWMKTTRSSARVRP